MVGNGTKKVEKGTVSPIEDQVNALRSLFPGIFVEGKIDFDQLRAVLGDTVDGRQERFSFTWAGKRDAILSLETQGRGTLVPLRNESISFDSAENILIEGENLEVLKLLYKPYSGHVKMIYLDPPYNTGKDFVYPDNYVDPIDSYLKLIGQADSEGNRLTTNPETSGRYHSSWLSMMYPRLFYARQLLREDGVIFVSIGDNEVANLRLVMNEIFGEENFIQHIVWNSKYTVAGDSTDFSSQHEHILCYARSHEDCEIQLLPRTQEMDEAYKNPDNDPRGPWKATPLYAKSGSKNYTYTFRNGRTWTAPPGRWPRFNQKALKKMDDKGSIWFGVDGKGTPNRKTYLSEVKSGKTPGSLWHYDDVGHTHLANEQLASLLGKGIFDNPKPVGLIKRCIQLSTSDDDIVMDFFAGSCTTAEAVLELNEEDGAGRRFIMVQIPEPLAPPKKSKKGAVLHSISDIGKERIKAVIERIKNSRNGKLKTGDERSVPGLALRVYSLRRSNFKQWMSPPSGGGADDIDKYVRRLEEFSDSLVIGWKPENVVQEIALKEGYGLNSRIQEKRLKDHIVYIVCDPDKEQYLNIVLDDHVNAELVTLLGLSRSDTLICRDSALDDETASNLALQVRLKTI